MAKIKIDVDYPIYDGANVTFKAPCDCTGADGLTVSYPGGSKTFTLCDSHGVNISGINDVFARGVPVKAILDVSNLKAFVQNGDNNSFIASVISRINDSQHVATGTYVGTGKNSSYAVTLNFDFTPKLVVVYTRNEWENDGNFNEDQEFALFINNAPYGMASEYWWNGSDKTSGWHIKSSWGNRSLSYGHRYTTGDTHNDYALYNMDLAGRTYYYVAIG